MLGVVSADYAPRTCMRAHVLHVTLKPAMVRNSTGSGMRAGQASQQTFCKSWVHHVVSTKLISQKPHMVEDIQEQWHVRRTKSQHTFCLAKPGSTT